jgi:hypothetical protein
MENTGDVLGFKGHDSCRPVPSWDLNVKLEKKERPTTHGGESWR